MELGVIAKVVDPMILYCDNSGVVAQVKEPGIIGKASTSK